MSFTEEQRRIYNMIRHNAPTSVREVGLLVRHSNLDRRSIDIEGVVEELVGEDLI